LSSKLLVTKQNSRVVRIEPDHPFNRIGIPFQAYCISNELNCNPKNGAIAVTLQNGVWHHIKIIKEGPILAKPLTSIHTYDKEEEPLQAALQEVDLNETPTTEEDEPDTPVQIRMENSSDDKREDPIDQQIRNSPIQLLIPLQQVLARIAMATTMTTHTTTIPKTTTKGAATSSSTDIATKFQKGMKRMGPPGGGTPGNPGGPSGGGPPGGGPPGGGPPGGGPPGGGVPGGIPAAPLA